jgi:hypothetical protein
VKTIDTPEFREKFRDCIMYKGTRGTGEALITHIDSHCAGVVEEALKGRAVALPAGPIAGWKLVPVEPTQHMVVIGSDVINDNGGSARWSDIREAWNDMVEAAPEVDAAQRCDSTGSAPVPPEAPQQPDAELERMRRMFIAACEDLGSINEALGLDPDDGGAEPILAAIEELKSRATPPEAEALTEPQKNTIRFAAEALEGLDYEDTAGDLRAILKDTNHGN